MTKIPGALLHEPVMNHDMTQHNTHTPPTSKAGRSLCSVERRITPFPCFYVRLLLDSLRYLDLLVALERYILLLFFCPLYYYIIR